MVMNDMVLHWASGGLAAGAVGEGVNFAGGGAVEEALAAVGALVKFKVGDLVADAFELAGKSAMDFGDAAAAAEGTGFDREREHGRGIISSFEL